MSSQSLVANFIKETKEKILKWKQMRQDIDECTLRLRESEVSIDTLVRNIGLNNDLINVSSLVKSQCGNLKARIDECNALEVGLKSEMSMCKAIMQELLELRKQFFIVSTTEESNDIDVLAAREVYGNLIDNHQLRKDPMIAGIAKDPLRDIKSEGVFAESDAIMKSNLDRLKPSDPSLPEFVCFSPATSNSVL